MTTLTQRRNAALSEFKHDHKARATALEKDNCTACVLEGRNEHKDNEYNMLTPNHCCWELLYVEAGLRIPARFQGAFDRFITDPKPRNAAYQANVRNALRAFGNCPVRYSHHIGQTCEFCQMVG